MDQIQKGKLTQSEYDRTRTLTPARVEELEAHQPRMTVLWGAKLTKVKSWHHPASISELVRELNLKIELPKKIFQHDWRSHYRHFNQAVHVSPSGHYLVGAGPSLPLMSVKKHHDLFLADVLNSVEAFLGALGRWDHYLVPGCRLLNRASREHDEYHKTFEQALKALGRTGTPSRRRE